MTPYGIDYDPPEAPLCVRCGEVCPPGEICDGCGERMYDQDDIDDMAAEAAIARAEDDAMFPEPDEDWGVE